MATVRLGGTGIPLNLTGALGGQLPQSGSFNPAGPTNVITLTASECFVIPAGTYLIAPGAYTSVQYKDPAAVQWRTIAADTSLVPYYVESDGANWRIANLTGCPVGALITNAGAAATYTNGIGTAATGCTVTASAGASVWVPVVGGAINSTVTITAAGSGYLFAPTIIFAAPPPGGVQATGTCTISAGAIASVTVTNQGAGYVTAPIVTIINDFRDTVGSGGILTVNATLVSSGQLTGLYPSGQGTPVTSLPTFTFAPASTTAATMVMNWVVTSIGVTTAGAGGTGWATPVTAMVINSALVAGTRASNVAGPIGDINLTQPRPAFVQMALSAGTLNTTGHIIIDAGFGFQAVPTVNLIGSAPGQVTPSVVTALVGGITDTSWMQPI